MIIVCVGTKEKMMKKVDISEEGERNGRRSSVRARLLDIPCHQLRRGRRQVSDVSQYIVQRRRVVGIKMFQSGDVLEHRYIVTIVRRLVDRLATGTSSG